MEPNSQPSFIPKRQTRDVVARAKSPTTLFYWIGVLVFVVAILMAVGLFVFNRFVLLPQLEEKKLNIKKEIEAFDPKLTETLTVLKQRIDFGKGLLSRHTSASAVFDLIEKNTVKGVYFSNFVFTANPGAIATIAGRGESPSYAVLAFQSEVLEKSNLILNPIFSGIDLNEKGRVNFELSAEISEDAVSYSKSLEPDQPEEEGSSSVSSASSTQSEQSGL
ncbi:MAG: hypothetical protein AAB534_02760 [Patescibacteria group bacterium]